MAGAKEARTSHLNSSHLFTYNKLFEPEYRENNILWDFVRKVGRVVKKIGILFRYCLLPYYLRQASL